MKNRQNQHLFGKTLGIALATASLVISTPTFAQSPSAAPTKPAMSGSQTTGAGTVVDVASSNPSFKTLVKAVKAAGLVETLSGSGPFTVFAPTDAAFNKLPKATLQKLLKPENKETLTKILTYHVVSGAVDSKSLKSGAVNTVEGSPVDVKVGKGVTVGKAKVTKPDIKASNGVIHAIDTVLLPPDVKL
ncbi:fasciclin domain-containing protein [Brasilonema bromeliae]|uniref:Fasciclin domain-containing protein n=1 Tax=Brasilonema bromeliae SPC951 TaxID=385972 RepID=A0ABX1PI60_9CYAN|nr:fasciclin domain-containing protein [Brasilonema bromeliae]NMG23087.1 fasciclin domain-containing protein [Brasilonema bromeliae SPC951]